MFDEALRRAHELDAFYEANGRPIGPLHGLPVSVKDNFKIAGYAATVGHSAWAHEIMAEDSELVKMLRGLGAVLYVKTNVPGTSTHNKYMHTLQYPHGSHHIHVAFKCT